MLTSRPTRCVAAGDGLGGLGEGDSGGGQGRRRWGWVATICCTLPRQHLMTAPALAARNQHAAASWCSPSGAPLSAALSSMRQQVWRSQAPDSQVLSVTWFCNCSPQGHQSSRGADTVSNSAVLLITVGLAAVSNNPEPERCPFVQAMGAYGSTALLEAASNTSRGLRQGGKIRVLTHCNTGEIN
jgi:hypothetical protein